MNLVVALACIKMNISPEAAINAATINGAYAMEIQDEYGSISIGKWANINLTNRHQLLWISTLFFWDKSYL